MTFSYAQDLSFYIRYIKTNRNKTRIFSIIIDTYPKETRTASGKVYLTNDQEIQVKLCNNSFGILTPKIEKELLKRISLQNLNDAFEKYEKSKKHWNIKEKGNQ